MKKYNHGEISSFVERLSQTDRSSWTAEDLDKLKDYSEYVDSFTHNDPHPEHPNRTNQIKDFNETDRRGSAMYTSPEFDKHLMYQQERATHRNVHRIGNIDVYDNEDYYKSNPTASPEDDEPSLWEKLKEKISHLTKN